MTPEKQSDLDSRLIAAAKKGDTKTVAALLAAGADVHAEEDDDALRMASVYSHMETVRTLLASGANVHAGDDWALRWAARNGDADMAKALLVAGASRDDEALYAAAYHGHRETVKILTSHIFAPDSWRGKSRVGIEALANALYDKIKAGNPSIPIKPERLRMTGDILIDCALACWEQVRPAPPKIQISLFAAQPRPL